VTTYGFNENDAKRVGRAVRHVERGAQKISLGGPSADGAAPGVRLLIAKHEGTAWDTQQTAVVTVFNGDPAGVASALTLLAYNEYLHFGTHEVCTVRWLSLGHNGFNWHPVDAQSDCEDCVSAAGGVDFTYFAEFEKTAIQILGHDAGCVRWFNVFQCPSTST
jgi:hypothetical protein